MMMIIIVIIGNNKSVIRTAGNTDTAATNRPQLPVCQTIVFVFKDISYFSCYFVLNEKV